MRPSNQPSQPFALFNLQQTVLDINTLQSSLLADQGKEGGEQVKPSIAQVTGASSLQQVGTGAYKAPGDLMNESPSLSQGAQLAGKVASLAPKGENKSRSNSGNTIRSGQSQR